MQTQCIGIDIGYGFTKICNEKGISKFPTAVCVMDQKSTYTELHPVVINGTEYLVGHEAEREGGCIDTRAPGFVMSNEWMAVLGFALNKAGFTGGDIILGVPPGVYTKEFCLKIVGAMKKTDMRINDQHNPHQFNGNVRIIPQGVGIYFRYLRHNPDGSQKNIVVIDVGHHTLDLCFFSNGEYVENSISEHLGISYLLDRIARAVYQQNQDKITHEEALSLINRSMHNAPDQTIVYDPKREILKYCQETMSTVGTYITKLARRPEVRLIGGGGAPLLAKMLSQKDDIVVVCGQTPEYANAEGYWYYGRQLYMEAI